MVGPSLHLVNERLGARFLVWAVLLFGLALGLGFVPLFDVLGYDFAFAMGLATAFAAVDVGHGAAAAARRHGAQPAPARIFARGLGGALGLLLLPLAASLLNAVRVRNCNLSAGLVFYALLPVGTALFAAPAGTLAGLWFERRGRVVAYLLPVLSILWTLLRLYFDPPVFAYDPFAGYFPGPIYDEAMQPPARLLWFRLACLVWVGAAVATHFAVRTFRDRDHLGPRARMGRIAIAAMLLGAGGVLFVGRGTLLGSHVTRGTLNRELSRETRSAHFIVRSHASAAAADIDLLHRDLEFRHHQLRRILGVEPTGSITVSVFPDSALKKDLVGAGGTLYAKPWTREIFIQADRFPASRLRHELAHVFAGAFGDPVFGVALALTPWPRLASGLIEGVAEAADFGDPSGRTTVHQDARAMIANGQAPPIDKVVGAGFSTLSGARAYTMAGSFCRFLLDTFGAEKLRALYRSAGDFSAVYALPLAALDRRWREFLESQDLPAEDRARARERFRRGAIFQKVCARELAARVAQARHSLGSPAAVALLESVCVDDPGEPIYKLDLADAHAAAGHSDQALAAGLALTADDTMTFPLRARAATLAATLFFHAGRFDQARSSTEAALTFATDDGERRTAMAKLRALAPGDDAARASLGRVLFGASPTAALDTGLVIYFLTEFARTFPDDALGPYLVGRQLTYRDARLALTTLHQACPLDGAPAKAIPLPDAFTRECHRLVGESAFFARDLPRARAAFERLKSAATTEADRLRASDFLERIDWEERR